MRKLADFSGDCRDAAAVKVYLAEKLRSVEGQPWYEYVKIRYAEYVELLPQIDEITARLEELHEELYRANQPVSHRFVIRRVDSVR